MSTKKITRKQLANKMLDLSIDDEELRSYFVQDADLSDAFNPVIVPNPQLVEEEQLEGAFFLNIFNDLARRRRNKKYKARIKNWTGIRVVAEGDSWFQYPLLLKDTIDHLCNLDKFNYAIYCLSEAGDVLSNIVKEDEISKAVEQQSPHVVLLSGGGNDLVRSGRLQHLVHRYSKDRAVQDYPNEKFDEFLNEIEKLYRKLINRLLSERPHLKIVFHGYDYAIPNNGKSLGKPLKKAKISNSTLQKNIVKELIERVNTRLIELASDYPGSVFHADCRGTVGAKKNWHDELHPNSKSFLKVANIFDSVIRNALAEKKALGGIPIINNELISIDDYPRSVLALRTMDSYEALPEPEYSKVVHSRAEEILGAPIERPKNINERRTLETALSNHLEKVHRESNFLPSSFLELGVQRAQAVCRIKVGGSLGSGFLVASREYIMTNNHVIASEAEARQAIAEFDYDEDDELYRVRLDPTRLFITSKELDFTIVACDSEKLPFDIVPLRLLKDPDTVTRGERVNIVQHPSGRTKEIAIHDNKVTYLYDRVIRYSVDTEPGSSGSPVFNNQWNLVAIHHAGWMNGDGGATNEGVRMSAIVAYLQNLEGKHEGLGGLNAHICKVCDPIRMSGNDSNRVADSGERNSDLKGLVINLNGDFRKLEISN